MRPRYRNDSQPLGSCIDQNFLGKSFFYSSHLQEICSLLHIFGLGNLPLLDNMAFLAALLGSNTIWNGSGLIVSNEFDFFRGTSISRPVAGSIFLLRLKASASDDQLVLSKTLTKARSLAPTERCHSFDVEILREGLLISGPSKLYPALWAVVFRVWVFCGIAEESP